jgi:Transglycosylase SLT domain
MHLSTAASRCCVLVVLLFGVSCALVPRMRALADDMTPTAIVEVTPEPTLVLPSPDLLPTSPPTVTRERSKPIATVEEVFPTSTLPPAPSSSVDVLPTPVPVHAVTPTPGPGTGTSFSPPSATDAPLPSPAELEQNARLRFGTGIPAAVSRWSFLIVPAAKKYGLSPTLLAAVMTMESGGDPLAFSGADARGLMQVLHGPWDPRENVFTGARMLREYHDEFPAWDLTLAAYNAGPNAVLTYHGIPPYRETRDYVIVVSYLWDLYSNHHLSLHRKTVYTSTLHDLERFSQQRKKLKRLATVAGIAPDFPLNCSGHSCDAPTPVHQSTSLDPFWPVGSVPDPLQHVGPGDTGLTS